MLQKLIQQHQQAIKLEQVIQSMPEYPIYHISQERYVIYIAGAQYVFKTEQEARMRQLKARATWLRAVRDRNK